MARQSRIALVTLPNHQVIEQLLPLSILNLLGCNLHTKVDRKFANNDSSITVYRYNCAPGNTLFVKRDSHEVHIEAYTHRRLLLSCGVRDRSLDGRGKGTKQNPLNNFPVTHAVANALPHPQFSSAEISVYSYNPDVPLPNQPLLGFIKNPDRYLFPWTRFSPTRFFPLWDSAFASGLAPWQMAPPVHGFAEHFVNASLKLLTNLGYNRAEAVPGWYNAAAFFRHRMSFRFLHLEHDAAFALLEHKLRELVTPERRFSIQEKAWIVALQNIPEYYLRAHRPQYHLGGIHWINSPTDTDYCCRLYRDLNEFHL